MLPRSKRWPCGLAIIFLTFFNLVVSVLSNYNTYEGSLPYRQEAADAIETECGAVIQVKLGEKYLFDSKSAAEYEATIYAAETAEGYNSGPTRRKRSTETKEKEKTKPATIVHQMRPNKQRLNRLGSKTRLTQGHGNIKNKEKESQVEKVVASASTNSEHSSAKGQKDNKQKEVKEEKQKEVKEKEKEVKKEKEKEVKDDKEKEVLKGRAYGGGGGGGNYSRPSYGHGYSHGGGYSNYNGENSHGGGYSHYSGGYTQGGGSYHRGGGGHNGYGYPAKPVVCEWTFYASDDCSLESHIIKFKPGDMDCYKQQLVISDNYTDFKMCGHQKLYPGFRAETPVMYIKYWKQPYTYRHVFKGYVTCVGRAQRPTFNYDDSYLYKPAEEMKTHINTHSHPQPATHNQHQEISTHNQPQTHISESQPQSQVSVSQSQHESFAHASQLLSDRLHSHNIVEHPGEIKTDEVIVKVVEQHANPNPVFQQPNPQPQPQQQQQQVFTAAQVQEIIRQMMAKQLSPIVEGREMHEAHEVNTHDSSQNQREEIIVQVQESQTHSQAHEMPELSVEEKMKNLRHLRVQEEVFGTHEAPSPSEKEEEMVAEVKQERKEAEQLIEEANMAMVQATHAHDAEEEKEKVAVAEAKLQEAEELLIDAAAIEKELHKEQMHSLSHAERPEMAHQIEVVDVVQERPIERENAFETGNEREVEQESVKVIVEESNPQSSQSKLEEAKQESRVDSQTLRDQMLASIKNEGENPSEISQTSTNSFPTSASDLISTSSQSSSPELHFAPDPVLGSSLSQSLSVDSVFPQVHSSPSSSDNISPQVHLPSSHLDNSSPQVPSLSSHSDNIAPQVHSSPVPSEIILPQVHSLPVPSESILPQVHLPPSLSISPQVHSLPSHLDNISHQVPSLSSHLDNSSPEVHSSPSHSDSISPHVHSLSSNSDSISPQINSLPSHLDNSSPQVHSLPTQSDIISTQSHPLPTHSDNISPQVHSLPLHLDIISPQVHSPPTHSDTISPQVDSLTSHSDNISPQDQSLPSHLDILSSPTLSSSTHLTSLESHSSPSHSTTASLESSSHSLPTSQSHSPSSHIVSTPSHTRPSSYPNEATTPNGNDKNNIPSAPEVNSQLPFNLDQTFPSHLHLYPNPTSPVVDPYTHVSVIDPYARPPPYPDYSSVPAPPEYAPGPHSIDPSSYPSPTEYSPSYPPTPNKAKYPSGVDPTSTYKMTEYTPYPLTDYSPPLIRPSYSYFASSKQMSSARNQLSETDYEQIAGRAREDSSSSSPSNTKKVPRPMPQPQPAPVPVVSSYSPPPQYQVPVIKAPPYQPPPPPPPHQEGYRMFVTSMTDPNLQYVVTCQLPYPYPCVPIQSSHPPPPPPPLQQVPMFTGPAMYGRR